jgi:flap endonuclease-1
MKSGELAKRKDRRTQAQTSLDEATEAGAMSHSCRHHFCIFLHPYGAHLLLLTSAGDKDQMEKFSRRLVKVLPEHNAQCQELLKLMGVPFIVVRLRKAARV